jgi:hypothetical protein
MRSLSVRILVSLLALTSAPAVLAHDVTINGTSSFSSLDGSSSDHDGTANGVFTVSDGNLIVNGVVNCNDDTTTSACGMAFNVSGNLTVNTTGALYAENRSGNGNGGAIALTVGGNLALNGNAIVSSASKTNSGGVGGAIAANVAGGVTLAAGSTLSSGSGGAKAGDITVAAGGVVVVDGNVLAGPSRALLPTRLTADILAGGTANQIGGKITIGSTTFVEPALVVGATATIASQGEKDGAGPVILDACGIEIRGLVAAVSRKESAATVAVRSGKNLLVDGRDLGTSGTRMGRVRADALQDGANNDGVDLFAAGSVQVLGPSTPGTLFAVSSVPGAKAKKDAGGTIRVVARELGASASGRAFIAGADGKGTRGGTISVSAAGDVNLDGATVSSTGDITKPKKDSAGGHISARSYSGNVLWRNGVGDVRPLGSTSGVPLADQGTIVLTACGTVDTTGSSFPVNGVATSVHPQTSTGVCSPVAPSLPVGVPPLVTCNTPPVANDTSATTNEDTTVTITLSGSDADGDSLTFTIVSGPSNGSLGPIISTGPTTATVDYTPNLNYNGGDSFVFRANDGNGGTDDAVATITIAPVNDSPSFLAGPTVSVLEDSGAQTYPNWATAISPGPADESGQTVTFTVTNDNPSLFSVQPALASNGTLTFTPAANAYGSATITVVAQDNGGTANGGDDTSNPQTSSINITPVNDEPSFVNGPSQTVNEDAGAQSVANWATAISAGPNESGQTLTFTVTSNNPSLFSAGPAVSASGTLTYTPAANANGSATVSVYLQDNGGTANGGDDTSPTQTFTITVNPVNDEPFFTSGGDVSVLEDSGAYSAAWATSISAGPADESGQTFSFAASNNNNALFAVQPSVASNGTLTFTPAANASGIATVTVTLSDSGGTANGGDDTSPSQTFTITVGSVNDEPSFTGGGDITVLEDSGTYSASWVSASSAGPNESQNLTYFASNNNNALFSVQPSIAPDGTLSFTLNANANGSATVSVYVMDDGGTANGGDDTSPTQTFTINVTPVNDAPSFTSGGNVTVNEDSGAYSAAWATAISAGPADESGQTVTFNMIGNTNPSLFVIPPSLAANGTLTFTLAANAFGTSTITVTLSDNGTTANGGVDTSAPQSFDIIVGNINDAPTFAPGGDANVLEDSGAYSAPWASSISAGPNEGGQTLTFVVNNDNGALFAAPPAISASGVLTFTPAANAFGTANVTVYLQDDGGTANGGVDTSGTVTFQIVVGAVNDAPSFVSGGDVTVKEDSGSYAAPWATSISAGPANEGGQSLTFTVTGNSNPALFASAPSIAPDGTLSFTPAANAFGSASITVILQDNGGTASGGADTSSSVTFNINVSSVNDPPSFTAGGNVTVNEDSGSYLASWATSISAGPGESQTLTFTVTNDNNALFSAQPSLSPAGILSFTPAPNAYGTANVTVTLSDGIDSTSPVSFVITVNGINDPPSAANDAWESEGNTELRVDLGAGLTPNVSDTTPSGKGVADNDADTVEGDPFTVTGIVGCGDMVSPYVCAVTGGTVTMNSNGTFSFQPAAGATSASFQYQVTDQPAAGTPASAIGSVTITIHDMIWYVNGAAAPGNGTSAAPFSSFAALNGLGDVDGFGDYIFVHTSAISGSIALEGGQRLWGEGVGLIIPRNLNGNGSPATIVAPGVKPTITQASGDVVTVAGVAGVEIAGLSLAAPVGSAIDVTSVALGTAARASIYSNTITAGGEGIDINAGAALGTAATINNTSIVSTGNGVDLQATDGNVTFAYTNGSILSAGGSGIVANGAAADILFVTGLSNVSIDGNTSGDGIVITSPRFDANPGTAAFDSVSGGTSSVGSSGNPVGGRGVVLTNTSGDLAFGSLSAYAGTSGVTITGTGLFTGAAGMRVTSGGGTINASSGVGLSATNATIGAANLSFTSISATGAANGIILNNTGTSGGLSVAGTGAANSGGTIQNVTGHGVLLTNTFNPSLNWMRIQNTAGSGVKGTSVTNFTFADGVIDNSGTGLGIEESNIAFNTTVAATENNLSGTVSIVRNQLTNAYYHGVDIFNFSGTIANATISDNTITSTTSTATSKGSGIRLIAFGSASGAASVTKGSLSNNVISNFPSGAGILAQGGNANAAGPASTFGLAGNAANVVTISGNRIAGNAAVRMATNAIGTSVNGKGQGNFDILGNGTLANPITNISGSVIVSSALGQTTVTARIANNFIDANHVAGFGGPLGISAGAAQTFATTDAPQYTVEISGNSVTDVDGNGILAAARSSNAIMKARVLNNSVAAPLSGTRQGIRVDSGTATGNTNLCLEISGNTSAGAGGATGIGLRKQGTNPAVNVYSVVGMVATSSPGVETYVDSQNPAGGGTQLLSAASGFTNCTLP